MTQRHPLPVAASVLSSLAAMCAGPAHADSATHLPTVQVVGHYINAVGSSDAASQGSVTAALIEHRPTLRPAEVLEFVPGLIVTQHSGDGKANQYFLRGFNLDHGTDFATYVDGMPVNMPTHAHGHGYSDLNWLIPELVGRIDYRKGPYYAEEGDFASAGAARIHQLGELKQGIASLTLGERGHRRALLANSSPAAAGTLLYALEGAQNDGPWENPERFRRLNGVLRYSVNDGDRRSSLSAMAYSARWKATDQIPQRAVDQGLIGRFGTLDASDGGKTSRLSLSFESERHRPDGSVQFNAYAIRSRVDLWSNFSFFLENPIDLDANARDGDQFQQSERRTVLGLAASRSWNTTLAGRETTHRLGVQVRHDRLDPVGLHASVARQRVATFQESTVRQTGIGLYAENSTTWTPWLRSVAGVRADHLHATVKSSIAANSGKTAAALATPKLSLVLGPWNKTELFVNVGHGFHSNDVRGTTATVAAKDTSVAAQRVDALVRSRGGELGLRTEIIPGVQSSFAWWQLRLGSELLFVGDAGETEPNRRSRRHGIEWNNHVIARPWLLFDADLALSRARFDDGDPDGVGSHVPGAVRTVASFGATITELGPWFGQFQLRHFGPRPLIEDNSRRSKGTTLASLRAGMRLNERMRLTLDVFNLFDRQANDIDYHYTSRLRGEAAQGVDDLHFHPVEPRSLRLTLTARI